MRLCLAALTLMLSVVPSNAQSEYDQKTRRFSFLGITTQISPRTAQEQAALAKITYTNYVKTVEGVAKLPRKQRVEYSNFNLTNKFVDELCSVSGIKETDCPVLSFHVYNMCGDHRLNSSNCPHEYLVLWKRVHVPEVLASNDPQDALDAYNTAYELSDAEARELLTRILAGVRAKVLTEKLHRVYASKRLREADLQEIRAAMLRGSPEDAHSLLAFAFDERTPPLERTKYLRLALAGDNIQRLWVYFNKDALTLEGREDVRSFLFARKSDAFVAYRSLAFCGEFFTQEERDSLLASVKQNAHAALLTLARNVRVADIDREELTRVVRDNPSVSLVYVLLDMAESMYQHASGDTLLAHMLERVQPSLEDIEKNKYYYIRYPWNMRTVGAYVASKIRTARHMPYLQFVHPDYVDEVLARVPLTSQQCREVLARASHNLSMLSASAIRRLDACGLRK